MTKPTFSDAQLEGLSEIEREGLLDDSLVDDPEDITDGEEDGAATATAPKVEEEDDNADDGDDNDDDNDDDNGDDDGQGGDDDNGADDAAAATVVETPGAADDEIKLDTRKASWLDLDTLRAEKQALNDELLELSKKFDEGELTAEELHQKRIELEERREPISTKLMRAEIGKEDAIDKWKHEVVPAFFEKNPAFAEKGGLLNQLLDAEVRKIQSSAANPTDPKILDLALSRINAQITLATGQAPQPGKNKKPARTPKPEVPPNLGSVPAASSTAPVDGTEYAYLDRLSAKDPEAYEDALKKLSPAQLDHYLAH